jgi:hypothetical protein
MDRAQRDGYWPLLQTVPNGTDIYRQMVDAAFSRNESQFYSLYNSILSYLIGSDYLNDVPMSDDIKRRVQSFIQTRDGVKLKQLSDLFRLSRDADIIRRVEERARSENSTLNVVVIIFGAIHYDNLRRLISASDVLNFDSTKSLICSTIEIKTLIINKNIILPGKIMAEIMPIPILATTPPINPDQVLLGLIAGAIFTPPKDLPAKKAKISVAQIIANIQNKISLSRMRIETAQ